MLIQDLQSVPEAIASCILRDRHTLRTQLESIRRRAADGKPIDQMLQRLLSDVDRSRQQAERRRASVPAPIYPDELPVVQKRQDILSAIRDNQVTVLCGETGSGKTTQLP